MDKEPVQYCPSCGQALRFPENIGGMLMACPNCGHRFVSSFKLAGPGGRRPVSRPAPAPQTPAAPQPTTATLAAKVAALYASKA